MVTLKKLPDNFLSKLILRSGPMIAGSRRLVWNKHLKRYVADKDPHGSITNYDGRVTQFNTRAQYEKALEVETAR